MLFSKKGTRIDSHALLPTVEMDSAMDDLVDAMDLMEAGDDGQVLIKRAAHLIVSSQPWFDPNLSYNPTLHRIKQALFHAAVVPDLASQPLPPPHPDLVQFFEPPRSVVKAAKGALAQCKQVFNVKQGKSTQCIIQS